MEFDPGEVVEWVIPDRLTLTRHRTAQRAAAQTAATEKKR